MKNLLKIAAFMIATTLIYTACKKEHSCENCRTANQPPIARAGKDTITACLFEAKSGFKAVLKDNKIVFFTQMWNTPENKFDIYDIATNSWSIGVLPVNITYEAIISYDNTIYVAGGVVNVSITQQV